jgi:hypothetical protein
MKILAYAMLWGVFSTGLFAQPRLAATSAVAIGRFPDTTTGAQSPCCNCCHSDASPAMVRVIGPYGSVLPDLFQTLFTLIRWRNRETRPKAVEVMFVWPSA